MGIYFLNFLQFNKKKGSLEKLNKGNFISSVILNYTTFNLVIFKIFITTCSFSISIYINLLKWRNIYEKTIINRVLNVEHVNFLI